MIKTFFAKNPDIAVVVAPMTSKEVFGYRIDVEETTELDSYSQLFEEVGTPVRIITLTREKSFFKDIVTPSRQYIVFINKVFYSIMSSEEFSKEFAVYDEGFCEKYKQGCSKDSCRRNFKDCPHLV